MELRVGARLNEEFAGLLGDLPLLPEDVEVDLLRRRLRCGFGGAARKQGLNLLADGEHAAIIEGGGGEVAVQYGIGEQAGLKKLRAGYSGLEPRGFQIGIVEDGQRHDGGLIEAPWRDGVRRETGEPELFCGDGELRRLLEIGRGGQRMRDGNARSRRGQG